MNLFARLANDNIGYVKWDPYIPQVCSAYANDLQAFEDVIRACSDSFLLIQIFTRILRSFNLPVGTSQMIVPRYLTNSYDIGHVVLWVSAMLVSVMGHLLIYS